MYQVTTINTKLGSINEITLEMISVKESIIKTGTGSINNEGEGEL